LDECGILGVLGKERKGRGIKCKRTSKSIATKGFACKYQVACMSSLLVLACSAYACGFLVMIFHWHGGMPGLTVDFLALSFLG